MSRSPPNARYKLLDTKNGAFPRTTSIRTHILPQGTNNAYILVSVPLLPNLKAVLDAIFLTRFRSCFGNLDKSPGTCGAPTTVLEAPVSDTPCVPSEAKYTGFLTVSFGLLNSGFLIVSFGFLNSGLQIVSFGFANGFHIRFTRHLISVQLISVPAWIIVCPHK